MTILSDHTATRRSQAVALVAAPVAGLVTTLVWPRTPLDASERLAILADAAERTQVAHTLNLVTIVLFIPAVGGDVSAAAAPPSTRGHGRRQPGGCRSRRMERGPHVEQRRAADRPQHER